MKPHFEFTAKTQGTHCRAPGGTGVAPVKSGVAPDFGGQRSLAGDSLPPRPILSPAGFGRDARNHGPEARATQRSAKPQPTFDFSILQNGDN
jgi:hypothetical protein